MISAWKAKQSRTHAAGCLNGIVSLIYLCLDLSCAKLLQIFVVHGMVGYLMTFRHHTLHFCFIRANTLTYHKEGRLAAILGQTVHDTVTNGRLRAVIEGQGYHRL